MIRLCIKELAEKRGILKPVDLARLTGLSFSVTHKLWNEQQTRIDLKTIESLCQVLKVSPGDLFDFSCEQPENQPVPATAPAARRKPGIFAWERK
jgi:DNA-binding Xre family transcriptional regulator